MSDIERQWAETDPRPRGELLAELTALRATIERLTRERDEARDMAGLGCDASGGGAHSIMKQGSYTFCHKCGETINAPTMQERARAAESALAKAQQERDEARAMLSEAWELPDAIAELEDKNDDLSAQLAKAREALTVARAQLVTLGGPARDAWGDTVQRAVLDRIDAALAPAKPETETAKPLAWDGLMPSPDDCPPAYDGCTCMCHRVPGIVHVVACCAPSAKPETEGE